MTKDMPDILKKILQRKGEEIIDRAARVDISAIKKHAELASPIRNFTEAIQSKVANGQSAVIAEIKKASPSKGVLRENFNPSAIAKSYQENGAACLSVLTDTDFFQGSDAFLKQARSSCQLPVIRKDFIIDPYQVYEARSINADCVLLIVAALDKTMLQELFDLACHLSMDVLVEVHDEAELEVALETKASLIGINNRNLHNFETALETTLRLKKIIPDDCIVITESGIRSNEDVELMRNSGVNSFLVGEAFMQAEDPGAELNRLFNT